MRPSSLLFLAGLALGACAKDPTYARLNVDDDCFDVLIEPEGDDDSASDDDSAGDDDSAAEDEANIALHSVPGFFDVDRIGTARLSPTQGPAQTRFSLSVQVTDTGVDSGNPVDAVDRVTVLVDNGSISVAEFDLDRSPGDSSRWAVQLGTGGDPDTTRRDDRICVALYSEER